MYLLHHTYRCIHIPRGVTPFPGSSYSYRIVIQANMHNRITQPHTPSAYMGYTLKLIIQASLVVWCFCIILDDLHTIGKVGYPQRFITMVYACITYMYILMLRTGTFPRNIPTENIVTNINQLHIPKFL